MPVSKIPYATKIPLASLKGENFYTIVIKGERPRRTINELWIFREGCGVALNVMSSFAGGDDPAMTYDGIRALDADGKFDAAKDELLEMK